MPSKPTREQWEAVQMVRRGGDTLVEAGAGTGKTTLLTYIADAMGYLGKRGIYAAFNAKIVQEAKRKMPANCPASTMHSIAIKHCDPKLRARLPRKGNQDGYGGPKRLSPAQRAKEMGISFALTYKVDNELVQLQPNRLSGIVMAAINNFCKSADPEITEAHFPYIDGLDMPETDPRTGKSKHGWENNRQLRARLLPYAQKMWPKLIDPDGKLVFEHAYYLKLAQLQGIYIDADFILFDEAQDVSPVMESIIRQQGDHAQLIFVGDSQQAINGFTGAINAMATLPAENRAFLTGCFRFGPAIAEAANVILAQLGAELRLRGLRTLDSRLDRLAQPRAFLTRTNALAVERLLQERQKGRSVHLVGGGTELVDFAKAAIDLKTKGSTWHFDLACFTSWGQVQEYVNNDEEGSDLKLMVKLIDEFGEDEIIEALGERMPAEKHADLVISTAHKSKGCEWDTVELGSDFPTGKDKDGNPVPIDPEMWRLMYVAITRAKQVVDVTNVVAITELLDRAGVRYTSQQAAA